MTRSLLTAIILWLWIIGAASAQNTTTTTTCYYPNGQPSPDVPCFANANVSMCCPEGSECLSDGTCGLDIFAHVTWPQLGTCTSRNWSDDGCPNKLCGAQTSNATAPQSVYTCPGSTASYEVICCAQCNCQDDIMTMQLPTGLGRAGAAASTSSSNSASSTAPVISHTTTTTAGTASAAVASASSSGAAFAGYQSPRDNFWVGLLVAAIGVV